MAFFLITNRDQNILRDFNSIVKKEIDHVMARFNAHVATSYGNPPAQDLQNLQRTYWLRLFEGVYDQKFAEMLHDLGLAHRRAGVDPAMFIGGFSVVGGDFLALATRHHSRALAGKALFRKVQEIQTAIFRMVTLSVDIALSAYFHVQLGERQTLIQGMVTDIDQEVHSSIADIGSLTDDTNRAAGKLHAVALQTSESATAAASAAAEALANAETVAAASEELHSSIAEIARQVDQTKSMVHRAVDAADATQNIV
ncbi:MAG: hypothetical protein K2X44_04400, partial [Magnetospirillum sp.]|nr:hypothetical protein [Magnetospirillum sp.]